VTEFFNSIGFSGIMALVGCWLIIAAIIGKLIALSHILQHDIVVQRIYQRALLAILGVVLLSPSLFALYQGPAARLLAPSHTDYVAPAVGVNQTLLNESILGVPLRVSEKTTFRGNRLRLLRTGLGLQSESCRKVESFGLFAHSVRQLKYQEFQGQVYLYVGDINSPKRGPTEVFLFSSSASAPPDGKIDDTTFQHLWSGASSLKSQQPVQKPFKFFYGGAQYQLSVSQIYKAMIGGDEIVVDFCKI
jgi:hypothetical protein